MTENDLRQPPTIIEPDSDDERRRKRQRIDEGSRTTDHGLAILQAALMLVVAAEQHTEQSLNLYDVLSPWISHLRDDSSVQITSALWNSKAPQIEPDSTLSKPTTPPCSAKIISRQQVELSRKDTKSRALNSMATGTTTNTVTTKICPLPSGRPLLAPPRLPYLKCGERIANPTSNKAPANLP